MWTLFVCGFYLSADLIEATTVLISNIMDNKRRISRNFILSMYTFAICYSSEIGGYA